MKKLLWLAALVLPMLILAGCSKDETTELPHYPDLINGAWYVYEIDGKNVEEESIILFFQNNSAISKNYPNEGETSYSMIHVPITSFKLTMTGSSTTFYMDVYGTTKEKGEFKFFLEHGVNGNDPSYICKMKARKMDETENTKY